MKKKNKQNVKMKYIFCFFLSMNFFLIFLAGCQKSFFSKTKITASNITFSSVSVEWLPHSSERKGINVLYKVVITQDAALLKNINKAASVLGNEQVIDWSEKIYSASAYDLFPDTEYYVAVMIKNEYKNNPKIYAEIKIKTLSRPDSAKSAVYENKTEINIYGSENSLTGSDFEVFCGQNPVYNVMGDYDYSNLFEAASDICGKYNRKDINLFEANSLNVFGCGLYEKKEYEDAVIVFRRAIAVNTSFADPHFNLSCMLSLLHGMGKKIDPAELIYNLQFSILLEGKYAEKLKNDSGLDAVRNETWFEGFLSLLENGSILMEDNRIYSVKNGNDRVLIAELTEENEGPYFYKPSISASPDHRYAAFIHNYKEKPNMFILTHYGFLIRITETSLWEGYNGGLAWHPDSNGMTFVRDNKILYFELTAGVIREIFHADRAGISEIRNLSFYSPSEIRFMGGSTFEYSFSGKEYRVDLDGNNFGEVPGGRVIKPEDLSGGE